MAPERPSQNGFETASSFRRGATLLELLAVIVIMSILAAVAIPVIAPALSNRQYREASRLASAFLTGARNRAMSTGSYVGVVLDRAPGLPEACVALSYAEVPPQYTGDQTGSTMYVVKDTASPANYYVAALTPTGTPTPFQMNMGNYVLDAAGFRIPVSSGDVGWINTIRVGDLVRFNYQGPYFLIGMPKNTGAVDQTNGSFKLDPATAFNPSNPNQDPRWPLTAIDGSGMVPPTGSLSYQIFRAPLKLAAGGIQLPGPTVIDLTCSGFDLLDDMRCPVRSTSNPNPDHISPWATSYSFQPIWPWAGANMGAISTPVKSPFGKDSAGADKPDPTPVIIMFAPSGAIESVWCWSNNPANYDGSTNPISPTWQAFTPTTPLYLMVGRRDLLPVPTQPPAVTNPNDPKFAPYLNWQDPSNYWIAINPQTGMVTTVETNVSNTAISNSAYGNGNGSNSGANGYGTFQELRESRLFARGSQRTGGR